MANFGPEYNDLDDQLKDYKNKLNSPLLRDEEKLRLRNNILRIENRLKTISQSANESAADGFDDIENLTDLNTPFGENLENYNNQSFQTNQKQKTNNVSGNKKTADKKNYDASGGPAIEPSKKSPFDRFRRDKERAKEDLKDEAKSAAKKEVIQVGKQLAKDVGKVIAQAGKRAVAWVVRLFAAATSEVWGPVLIAIVIAVIIIILFLVVFSSKSKKSPSPTGASTTQAVDPVKDSPLIAKLLAFASDTNTVNGLTTNFFAELQPVLDKISSDPATDPALVKIIKDLTDAINTYKATPSKDNGAKIVKLLKDLEENLATIPVYPGVTKPILTVHLTGNTLHGGTAQHPELITHHSIYHWKADTVGVCDAVDLAPEKDRVTKRMIDPSVHAAFGGTVTLESEGTRDERIIINDGNGYHAYYAHIKRESGIHTGSHVNAGDLIAVINPDIGHVHFELDYNKKCVITTHSDVVKQRQVGDPIGDYLWLRMKRALKLQ